MSIAYGGAASAPPRKVNFNWISEAWTFFSQASGVWIAAIFIYGLVSNLAQAAFTAAFPNPDYVPAPSPFQYRYDFGVHYGTNSNVTPLGQVLSALFLWAFGAFQSASLYRLAIKQVRGEMSVFGDAFGGGPRFRAMLVYNLLISLAAVVGAFVFCVGVFVVAGFLLPGSALVADGESPVGALGRSVDAMKQDWLTAALFVFVYFLLILASAIPCGLGLLVTLPMLHVISALAYRDMIGLPGMRAPGGFGYDVSQPGVWPPPPTTGQTPPPPGAY